MSRLLNYAVFLLASAALLVEVSSVKAQVTYTWQINGSAPPGDWNSPASWDDPSAVDVQPEGSANERALINNGGTAYVQDVIDNTGASGSGKLGPGDITLAGASTLEIRSGALMSTDSSGTDVNGAVNVSQGATLRMIGNGALSADSLALAGDANFDYRVTAASSRSNAPADVNGVAQLGGTLKVNFSGVSFLPGDTLALVDAVGITGNFSQTEVTGLTTSLGQRFNVRTVAGGRGKIAQLALDQMLVLTVNHETGVASISNPAATPIAIDGYSIASGIGAINSGNFNGLGAGWTTSGVSSPARVTQLRNAGTSSFSGGVASSLGAIFRRPAATQFGTVVPDDLQFTYSAAGNVVTTGVIQYVGDRRENNIVLTIDPTTGMATMQNESTFAVNIEGYTITSSLGLLDVVGTPGASAWNSLDAQSTEGNTWVASPTSSATRVTELQNAGVTPMPALRGFSLGKLYDSAGLGNAGDVTFQFLLAGETVPFTGIVVFGALPNLSAGLTGDFNNDNSVDGADFLAWQRGQSPTPLSAGDLQAWKSNFGSHAATGAVQSVPEPSALLSVAIAIGLLPAVSRRRVL